MTIMKTIFWIILAAMWGVMSVDVYQAEIKETIIRVTAVSGCALTALSCVERAIDVVIKHYEN